MKQVIQNVRSGKLSIEEVPPPVLRDEGILVHTCASLVSAGTERMVMKLARKSLLGKAKERPDLVRKVMQKARREGLLATFQAVNDRLDREMPLGYSACGRVIAVGSRAGGFAAGQLVACAGAGFANHAERIYVPRLLAAHVPPAVSPEAAAYTTVGAIALQGIRNADLRVGETAVIIGLGLIGQLAVQILKASGCRVIGLDPAEDRIQFAAAHGADLALSIGAEHSERIAIDFTRGRGADAIIITAATTSNAPVELAARLARQRARVVMVGVTGMDIPRKPYYEKELTFIVSRSYGPGRYDPEYEQHGRDYPAGYVRWTEQRNLEAFLDLVAAGNLRPEDCTTHRFSIAEAEKAFDLVLKGQEPCLGVILTYPDVSAGKNGEETSRIDLRPDRLSVTRAGVSRGLCNEALIDGQDPPQTVSGPLGVSFIGAGNFARGVLLPGLARVPSVEFRGIVTASGLTARSAAKKFGFAFCGSCENDVLRDEGTHAVVIATPHSRHADEVCAALAAGKAVFVEKPLATSLPQLRKIHEALQGGGSRFMVGYNRRFSPLAAELKQFFQGRGPKIIHYRCNAGPLPGESWIADPAEGGRIIGEACHFIDLFAYLTDAMPISVFAASRGEDSADDAAITVTYEDGSVCQLIYTSAGSPGFSKERVEVFAGGATAFLEDFCYLHMDSGSIRRTRRSRLRAQKGHTEELAAFVAAVRHGSLMPIEPASLIATTLVTLAALESVKSRRPVPIADLWDRSIREDSVSASCVSCQ